ncbi:CLUMA_CG011005, isoform A [Clunio marinus]|uniref:CLUMA_CG011005, isoform A n=1 Tax=Clunio marinus TaxID=568069 RepID=A0A1J1IBN1_9DIPT|nr:CLUMA_CG011005, isoform A [Clunio marinus]
MGIVETFSHLMLAILKTAQYLDKAYSLMFEQNFLIESKLNAPLSTSPKTTKLLVANYNDFIAYRATPQKHSKQQLNTASNEMTSRHGHWISKREKKLLKALTLIS